jgi:hypothetical protein
VKKTLFVSLLAVALMMSAVVVANADSVTYTGAGTPRTASGNVTVTAAVNPKITLTVGTPDAAQTVDFGTQDPGSYAGKTVNLTVNSNKQFDLVASQNTAAFGGITLNRSLAAGEANIAKGAGIARADNYDIVIPWTTDPGAYTATVTYTVTQD